MLANAEVEVASAVIIGLEVAGAIEGEPCLGGRSQVGRTAEQPGNILCDRVECLRRRVAGGEAFGVGRECGQVLVPACGQLASLHEFDLLRQFRIILLVLREHHFPLHAQLFASLAYAFGKVLAHTVRHQELSVFRPAVNAFRQTDFLFTECLTVRFLRVLFIGSAERDVAVNDDQRWPVMRGVEDRKRAHDLVEIIRVGHMRGIPSITGKTLSHIFAIRERRFAFNRDVIVVVHPAKVG